jgi:hypothetical protein
MRQSAPANITESQPEPEPLDLDAQFRAAYEATRRVSSTASETVVAEAEALDHTMLATSSSAEVQMQETQLASDSDDSAYQKSLDIALISKCIYTNGICDID